jgi:uncharacterized protein YdeI (YjbR/CyaY-like superfamily)
LGWLFQDRLWQSGHPLALAVEEALCYGWIDGIRKSTDDTSYKIRFTPRRPGSIWSAVNIKHAETLLEQGLIRPAGLRAFEARQENKPGIYSYEQRRAKLEEPDNRIFKKNKKAWDFFQVQPPSYRKAVSWWIVSAKKQETQRKRLEKLIEYSRRTELIPEMARRKPAS